MRGASLALLFLSIVAPTHAQAPAPVPAAGRPTLLEVRVHGNHSSPDAEIVALAGVTPGQALPPDAVSQIEARLRATGRFDRVEVRIRHRSLSDTGQVVLILLISEPARGSDDLPPARTPMRRLRNAVMFMPIVDYTDGYGLTFGGRTTFADVLGKKGRLTAPLTWGGVRRAAIEADKQFARGFLSRIEGGASISQRENPHYRLDDRRTELRARAERGLWRGVRVGGSIGWTDVSFGSPATPEFDLVDRFASLGADVTVDTRLDPSFPRDGVYLRAGWEALRFDAGITVHRFTTEARGYVGLIGSSVLSVRARYGRASAPLPPYEQWLLGGASTLRGYRAGSFAGDTMVATSAEVRMPLTSPLRIAKTGVHVFIDSGTGVAHGTRLRDARMHSGAGAGVFLIASVFQLNVDVARAFDGGTRVHVTTGFGF